FGTSLGSRGDWREYNYGDVKRLIFENAGNPDLAELTKQSDGIKDLYQTAKREIISRLTVALENKADSYLRSLLERSEKTLIVSANDLARFQLPSQVRSRDSVAMGQGLRVAPHQEILTSLMGLASPARCVRELAQIARQAGSHLARMEKKSSRNKLVGTNVFIGLGRAFAWRDLKDFISDRLKLPYDEFNRIPIAGITNVARLSEMLESAAVAFVILTAEDEQADNKMHARLNVIHEVGLFQGRLGFTKAIVLIEDGCEQFSNIEGLGQIRFPKGKISEVFEEIRRVLEREGLIA
ncbi:MAG: TIR domain-containing protein, partial [Methylocella sp.]